MKKFSVGPIDNNIYSIIENKNAVVIDPSFGGDLIYKYLLREKISLKYILLTHSHWDHIVDVKLLKEKTEALIGIHEKDAPNLEKPGSDGLPYGSSIEGVKPDLLLIDSQVIKVDNLEIKVLHTPGHTLGSLCFYLEREKMLFSGDTLFHGTIGRTDLKNSDPKLMYTSLKKLLNLPKETQIFPGHGVSTSIAALSKLIS